MKEKLRAKEALINSLQGDQAPEQLNYKLAKYKHKLKEVRHIVKEYELLQEQLADAEAIKVAFQQQKQELVWLKTIIRDVQSNEGTKI